jgi:hypothetical protein
VNVSELSLIFVGTGCLVVAVCAQVFLTLHWDKPRESQYLRASLRHWARARVVAAALAAVSGLLLAMLLTPSTELWVLLVPVVFTGLILRRFIEDAVSGVLLLARVPFGQGDMVETGGRRGVVIRAGLTSLRIRGFDRIEHDIPWSSMVRQGVSRMSLQNAEVPVEVDLPWNVTIEPGTARSIAAMCAATSPFASLHSRPETFLIATPGRDDQVCVRVRGFVFEAEFAEAFRSHVLEAWLERTSVKTGSIPLQN